MDTPDILNSMADTYTERQAMYGKNYIMVGKVLQTMYPNGVTLNTAADHERWYKLVSVVVKMTRFVASDLTHQDSIHDAAVFCAMLESGIEGTVKVGEIYLDGIKQG